MKTNFEELANQAAAYEAGEAAVDPETQRRKLKKKRLAISMLVLNAAAFVLVAVGFFFDVAPCTFIGVGLAVVSFVLSRICKRV